MKTFIAILLLAASIAPLSAQERFNDNGRDWYTHEICVNKSGVDYSKVYQEMKKYFTQRGFRMNDNEGTMDSVFFAVKYVEPVGYEISAWIHREYQAEEFYQYRNGKLAVWSGFDNFGLDMEKSEYLKAKNAVEVFIKEILKCIEKHRNQ